MKDSRDVIDALFRNRPASRVGLNDFPWGDTLEKWVTQGMPTDDEGKAVNCADHFGFDIAGCGGWYQWEPWPGTDETIEENDDWRITRNGAGGVLKWWKTHSGTPEHIDFAMTSREIWDRDYRPGFADLNDPSRCDIEGTKKALAEKGDRFASFGHQFIWENFRASMGDYVMLTSLIEDPEWIHDMARVYTDLTKAQYGMLFEQAGKPDGVFIYEDLGYKGSLFCNPKLMEDLIFPYYAEMVDFYHSYDLPVMLHACGYIEEVMPLIVDAGFDALNPMEAKAGNDIFKYADQYGDKLAFVGGFDARILERGDRAEIRQGVIDFVEGLKARGARLVFGSDHSLSTNIDYQEFLYAIEVYKEHMVY
jgi:uroporphyrinogen decarboxylase